MADKTKTFSDYNISDALELLKLPPPHLWRLAITPRDPSPFLRLGLEKATTQITTGANEQELRFFMELFFMETLSGHHLRMWQERPLDAGQSPFRGIIDFVFTPYQVKLTTPFLVLSEAKKEDFEQGWGQCLLAMKTCQLLNARDGRHFDVYGIVSTGAFWEFGKLTTDDQFYKSSGYTITQPDILLGALDDLMTACEQNIANIVTVPQNPVTKPI